MVRGVWMEVNRRRGYKERRDALVELVACVKVGEQVHTTKW